MGALWIAEGMAIQSPLWGRWFVVAVGLPFTALGIYGLATRGPDPLEGLARLFADPANFGWSLLFGSAAFFIGSATGVQMLIRPFQPKPDVLVAPWCRWPVCCQGFWVALAGVAMLWTALRSR